MADRPDYSPYEQYVASICKGNDLSNFKRADNYTYMLEHVSSSYGQDYLDIIRRTTTLQESELQKFCALNDSIGNPNRTSYGSLTVSPTSLRYILHAHLILTHLQSLNLPSIDIVEIGGGYGGLCLAIHHFAAKYALIINSYTIIDLPAIIELQKLYLSKIDPTTPVTCVSSTTFGETIDKKNMFLVSNYCFSEISSSLQKQYIETLFPKISHGFFAWNTIPTYDFGFAFREEKEYPFTANYNKYVYF